MLPISRKAAYTSCPFSSDILKTLNGTRISPSGAEHARFTPEGGHSQGHDSATWSMVFPSTTARIRTVKPGGYREQRSCASDVWHSHRIAPVRNDFRTEPSRSGRGTTSGRSIDFVRGYLGPVFLGIGRKFSQLLLR
jgi:hypothetical protein